MIPESPASIPMRGFFVGTAPIVSLIQRETMRVRHAIPILLTFSLSSCALIKAPFTIAGSVVEGTYYVGEKMVTAPIDAYDRRQERKEAEKAKKEKEDEKAGKQKPSGGAQPTPLPEPLPLPEGSGELPPIPPPN
jgi:hypothetical protein